MQASVLFIISGISLFIILYHFVLIKHSKMISSTLESILNNKRVDNTNLLHTYSEYANANKNDLPNNAQNDHNQIQDKIKTPIEITADTLFPRVRRKSYGSRKISKLSQQYKARSKSIGSTT
jgi:hypothetical protein